jgi:hypothetical protein
MRAAFFLPALLLVVSCSGLSDDEKKKQEAATVEKSHKHPMSQGHKTPAPADDQDQPKKDDPKVDLSYLEKTWGLQLKAQKVGGGQITFRLEFTKDVENLTELRQAFRPGTSTQSEWALVFYFLDDENVVITKYPPGTIEGEITGQKGDAIRVTIQFPNKTAKIIARPGEKVKKK